MSQDFPCYTSLQTKQAVLEALLEVKKYRMEAYGICANMLMAITGDYEYPEDVLYSLFPRWPKFSGVKGYPIKAGSYAPSTAYSRFRLWDKRTKYGKARWELLDFLITELQKEISNDVA